MRVRLLAWFVALCLVPAVAFGQPGGTQPRFRTETALVTVDAVVVDDRGQPVTGLTTADFEVLDEGVAQRVEFFQETGAPGSGVSTPARKPGRYSYATNVGAQATATRTFVLVFDDLHLTREQGEQARLALSQFIRVQLVDGDLVSLVVPGIALRWHARLPGGRDELLRIAEGLQGRFQPEPTFERITDYEAYRIHVFQDEAVANSVDRRWRNYRQLGRESTNLASDRGFQPQERGGNAGVIQQDLAIRAADVYSRLMARNRVTLGSMKAMVEGLEAVRGRKSVLLFSAGLIEDQEQIDARHVLDAARRANVAVYFIDVRGIGSGSAFATAQFGSPLDTRDVGFANAQIELEVQGSENLAIDTGGFSVRNANDLNAALGRISRELSSYYLLGFQPSRPGADGAYRKLQVRVRRLGVTVRARKGYYVTGDRVARAADVLGHDALQPVTDSPYDLDTIPLRVASYVFGSPTAGKAVVSLAIEADLRAFGFITTPLALTDVLELRIAATHLESSTAERYDGQVEMTFPLGTRLGEDAWYGLAREFTLAPGRYQARIAVRDRNNGRIGALTHVFDVPALDGLRVTTPIITDTIETPTGLLPASPKPVLVARREFPAGATVYYQFSVLGIPRGARILAGHQVRDAAGTIIKQLEPRAITPAPDGALSRFGGLSMKGLPAGEYELTLTVVDEAASRTIQLREPFAILPPAHAQ
ncbi:VWFA-related Acidobacterial domain protein [Luteitalea pratensis]|uniref:VWFA-related Acidobacterial domain protein n=1 Tax=Luteitalea pratensis TaxID=1855912 RepID=A0A143PWP4_LUTPR|nr:VWA domain-containing protein [Luteitalea pratensis]AMY12244.1 VWFA-related Acidobacterial domain protein [Luteitalea pratensis]